jgi:peptidoglycan/xylan/chitin deacetylase (PgdA/CDA1 family)
MDPQQSRTRREHQRESVRRRRRTGVMLALLLCVAAAAAAIAAGSGGSSSAPHRSAAGPHTRSHARSGRRGALAGTVSASAQGTGRPGSAAVPILMYHVIAPPPPGAKFPGLYVTPEELRGQVQALAQAGWHAVTMDQMQAYWSRGVALPAGHPIVLSFDNGYHSQYSQALPILRSAGWAGVENLQLVGLPPSQGGLSPSEVRALVAAGWELDTQGFSHADLIALSPSALHYEVAIARQVMQQRYGVPVNWFCYPSGHYNATVVAAVRAAGYRGSTTTIPGWARPTQNPDRLERIRVLGGTSPQALLRVIAAVQANGPPPPSYSGGGGA